MTDTPLILIVDDEQDFLEIFGTKLSSAGFRVETAGDGEEGIEKAKKLQPDLVLMDVRMPNISGSEAVLRLKDDPDTKNIKIVFLTSLGEPQEEAQSISSSFSKSFGADGYIRKTDDLDDLVEKVKKILQ